MRLTISKKTLVFAALMGAGLAAVIPACKTKKKSTPQAQAPTDDGNKCVASLALASEKKINPAELIAKEVVVKPIDDLGEMQVFIKYDSTKDQHDVAWMRSCLLNDTSKCVTRILPPYSYAFDSQIKVHTAYEEDFPVGQNRIYAEICVWGAHVSSEFSARSDKAKFEKAVPADYPNPTGDKLYCTNSGSSTVFTNLGWTDQQLKDLQFKQRNLNDQIFAKARTLQRQLRKYLKEKDIDPENPPKDVSSFDGAAIGIVSMHESYGVYLTSLDFEQSVPVTYAAAMKAANDTKSLKLTDDAAAAGGKCITQNDVNTVNEIKDKLPGENNGNSTSGGTGTPTPTPPPSPVPNQPAPPAPPPAGDPKPASPAPPTPTAGDDDEIDPETACMNMGERLGRNFYYKNGQCWDKNDLDGGPMDIRNMMANTGTGGATTSGNSSQSSGSSTGNTSSSGSTASTGNTGNTSSTGSTTGTIPSPNPIPPGKQGDALALSMLCVGWIVAGLSGAMATEFATGKSIYGAAKNATTEVYPGYYQRFFSESTKTPSTKLPPSFDSIADNISSFSKNMMRGLHSLFINPPKKFVPVVRDASNNVANANEIARNEKLLKEAEIKYTNNMKWSLTVAAIGLGIGIAGTVAFVESQKAQGLTSDSTADYLALVKKTAAELVVLRDQFIDNGDLVQERLHALGKLP